jgi:hypothetical protein
MAVASAQAPAERKTATSKVRSVLSMRDTLPPARRALNERGLSSPYTDSRGVSWRRCR